MAVTSEKSKTIYAPISSSARYSLTAYFKEYDISEDRNKHYIRVIGTIESLNSGTSFSTSSNHTLRIYWQDDGDNRTRRLISETTVRSLGGNESEEVREEFSVEGNDDGDLEGRAICVWTKASNNSYVPDSDEVATDYEELTHIDTYAEITKFKVYKVDEHSVEIDYDTDVDVDRVRYNIDGGTYHTLPSDGIIGGLNAGEEYEFRLEVRRRSNGLITDSKKVYQTTYSYPYANNLPSFNIGTETTIGLYNPLGRTVDVSIITADNQEHYVTQTNGSSITGFNDSTWKNIWVNSIPNAKSGTYRVKVVYGNIHTDTSSLLGVYTIDNTNNEYSPTFESSYWSYVANLTNLTNNNQVIIDSLSTITFTIDTQATAKYGSSIDFYRYKWGDISSTTGSVVEGNGNILEVTAVDTRGFSTTTYLELTDNYINYIPITTTEQTTHREGGAGSNTFLNVSGNMFCKAFGSSGITNTITSGKYYVLQQDQTWSSPYTLDLTNISYSSDYNRFTLNNVPIHANGTSGGFVVGQSYTLKIDLTDSINTYTFTGITVADGKMARDVYKDYNGDYHEGINGLANSNYTQEVHGTINATNNIYVNGVPVKTTGITVTELFHSSNGSTSGNLSETVDNYDKIEVYCGNNSYGIVCQSFVPNKTPYIISGGYTSAGTNGNWFSVDTIRVNFSAKTSFSTDCRYSLDQNDSISGGDTVVFLVLGIKYS